jgi:hypothetical protein
VIGLSSPWVRFIAAVTYVLLVAAPWYIWSGHSGDELQVSETLVLVLFGVVGLATGFLVGRWWVIPVVFVPAYALLPLGVDPQDHDGWSYAALLFLPGLVFDMSAIVFVGLVARLVFDVLRARVARRAGSRAPSRRLPEWAKTTAAAIVAYLVTGWGTAILISLSY